MTILEKLRRLFSRRYRVDVVWRMQDGEAFAYAIMDRQCGVYVGEKPMYATLEAAKREVRRLKKL